MRHKYKRKRITVSLAPERPNVKLKINRALEYVQEHAQIFFKELCSPTSEVRRELAEFESDGVVRRYTANISTKDRKRVPAKCFRNAFHSTYTRWYNMSPALKKRCGTDFKIQDQQAETSIIISSLRVSPRFDPDGLFKISGFGTMIIAQRDATKLPLNAKIEYGVLSFDTDGELQLKIQYVSTERTSRKLRAEVGLLAVNEAAVGPEAKMLQLLRLDSLRTEECKQSAVDLIDHKRHELALLAQEFELRRTEISLKYTEQADSIRKKDRKRKIK